MVDPLSGSVADNIARAHLGAAYLAAHTRLSAGRMRKFNFCCVTHYIGGKSRTVNTSIRVCSAVFVAVSYELERICNNFGTEIILNFDSCLKFCLCLVGFCLSRFLLIGVCLISICFFFICRLFRTLCFFCRCLLVLFQQVSVFIEVDDSYDHLVLFYSCRCLVREGNDRKGCR